jgi:hypothetical protein
MPSNLIFQEKPDSGKDIIDGDDNIISKPTTLKELAMSPDESSDAQALASVPQPILEQALLTIARLYGYMPSTSLV